MWQLIDSQTDRLKVPGGWIVRSTVIKYFNSSAVAVHQIFVDDPRHAWVLPELSKPQSA